MKQAYNCGINFFDTAERYSEYFPSLPSFPVICRPILDIRSTDGSGSYAGGQSEVMMGQAIKKYQWKRNDIVISTKVSFRSDGEQIMEDI
jgi:aryl-alcohol dehydrogenase-like predicted oxidoreductase